MKSTPQMPMAGPGAGNVGWAPDDL